MRSLRVCLLFAVLLPACGGDEVRFQSEPSDTTAEIDGGGALDGPRKDGALPRADASRPGTKADASAPAKSGDASVSKESPLPPVHIDGCEKSMLSAQQVSALEQGGDPGSARIVYPYDGTVFPRGIEGPMLMWDGADVVDAVYLRIRSESFSYEGCLTPTGVNQLQLPQAVWDTAGDQTGGKRDPFSVELTLSSGGKVRGPLKQSWIIAKATIKGSVYYNSYSSLLPGAPGGKVFRIPPKGKAEGFLVTECNGCHSLSANGTRMVSQSLAMGGRSYDVASGTPRALPAPSNTGFAAMYPDGSRYVVGSGSVIVGRMAIASPLDVLTEAGLYETDSGRKLASEGLPKGALMPSFSPDGTLLVFNDAALGAAGLALVEFDEKSNRSSNYRKLVETSGAERPGWPFVLPDNGAVVYVKTDGVDFSGNGAGVGVASVTQIIAPYSELFMVDVSSGKSTILARAMGYASEEAASKGQSYLPFPDDTRKTYFPTVSPVAAGGYVWLFFDSLRHYGNLGMQRQLWATAIELSADGSYESDRSAPAFYLPGQEFGTGNHRAFTALDPCKESGESCESGVDCCEGICQFVEGRESGVCGPPGEECAQTDDHCETTADCCETEDVCIAGFCAAIIPQ